MKSFLICISVVLLFGALSQAAEQDIENHPSRKNTLDRPADQQALPMPDPGPQQKTKSKKEKKGKNWPRPFVPTERINADSAVSFPIDI